MTRMRIWWRLEAFWRSFRDAKGTGPARHGGDSLARALRESTHVRGGSQGMGMGRGGTEAHHRIVAEGHEHSTTSLEDDD
ncbi:MAG: hypothetical protein R3290_00860 [Acidimicrobiia bacterium]|nr:hypothetical protein [Acidimicrobiia bacterium]